MQDKSKLGTRHTCFQCGLNFYDLNRPEPLCPKCGADQRENPNPDPREAFLAKYRGKGGAKGVRDGDLADDEELEEDAEVDDEDVDADEDEEGEEPVEEE